MYFLAFYEKQVTKDIKIAFNRNYETKTNLKIIDSMNNKSISLITLHSFSSLKLKISCSHESKRKTL